MELKDVKWVMQSETPVEYGGAKYIVVGCIMRLGRNARAPIDGDLYYTLTLKDTKAKDSYVDVGIEEVTLKTEETKNGNRKSD